MEEEKKSSGLTIVIIILLVVMIALIVCFFKRNDLFTISPSNTSSNTKDELEDVKITESLEQDLSRLDKFYINGNIGNIDPKYMINNITEKYVLDNNVDLTVDIECFKSENAAACKQDKVPDGTTVNESVINKLIADTFNTDRVFTLSKGELPYYEDYIGFGDLGDYLYNFDTKTYSFGHGARGSINVFPLRETIKVQKSKDYMYVYSKEFYCDDSVDVVCANYSYLYSDGEEGLIFQKDIEDTSSKEFTVKDGEVSNYNFEYIKENYGDNIQTYKFTFKQGNNNTYYWVETQLINE